MPLRQVLVSLALALATLVPSLARADGVLWYYGNSGSMARSYMGDFDTALTAVGATAIDYRNTWPSSFSSYHLVILINNTSTFSVAQRSDLSTFLAGGGTLVVTTDYPHNPAAINSLIGSLGATSTFIQTTTDPSCTRAGRVVAVHPYTAGVTTVGYGASVRLTLGRDGEELIRGESGQIIAAVDNDLVLITDSTMFYDSCDTPDNPIFWQNLFTATCADDDDGDGFVSVACSGTDCDDTDPGVNPDAEEVCDGIDNDCDGTVDEDDAADATTWCLDADADSWGSA